MPGIMEEPRAPWRWRRAAWLALFVISLVIWSRAVAQAAALPSSHVAWYVAWFVALAFAVADVVLAFQTLQLTVRFPIGAGHWARHFAIHISGGIVYTTLYLLMRDSVGAAVPGLFETPQPPLTGYVFAYSMVTGFMHLGEYARRYWRAEAAGLRLRVALSDGARHRAEAELRALKAELNPHFLGNTLHAVSGLLHTDAAAADRMLGQLGELLRATMARAATQEVTLREELEQLEPFLAVERARFGDRLVVERDIAPDALDALVPDMILQPLAENAVKHSLAPNGGGRLRLGARRAGARLELVVQDDGRATDLTAASRRDAGRAGLGLTNTRARLAELYGAAGTLDLTVDGEGTRARVTMPWHETDLASAAIVEDGAAAPESSPNERTSVRQRVAQVVAWASCFILIAASLTPYYRKSGPLDAAVGPVFRDSTIRPLEYDVAAAIISAFFMLASAWTALRITRRRMLGPTQDATDGVAGTVGRRVWMSMRTSRVPRALLLHGAAALSVGVLQVIARASLLLAFGRFHVMLAVPGRLMTACLSTISTAAVFYGLMLVPAHLVEYVRRYRRAEAAGLRLRVALSDGARRRAEAELRALKAELNPHFLGNALHAVSGLLRTDPAAADRVLGQLGELLRATLARVATQEVTLREELEQLEPFLAVERARFGERLEVSWSVDEAALGARVPHMILQPLVENAVKHGLAPRSGAGHIEVAARRTSDRLELLVRDDGVGLDPMTDVALARVSAGGGVGLANTRARLSTMYGGAATLELAADSAGGAVARLLLPWQETNVLEGGASRPSTPVAT